jgi:hypothetical protein
MSRLMLAWPGEWEHGRWLQYRGWRKGQFFIGLGEQQKKRHGIMQASGSRAHTMLPGFLECPEWYCTRIDVQITVPCPTWVSLGKLHKKLGRNGTSLITGPENDTLYLGARTSELFTRIYEKILDEKYLRLEFELKGRRAISAWKAMLAGENCDRIYKFYLDKCKLPRKYIELFDLCDDGVTNHAMTVQRVAEAEKTLKWLESLDSAVLKAIGNHEIGDRVKVLVRSWSHYSDEIDKKDNIT